jgi:hypothetical protein
MQRRGTHTTRRVDRISEISIALEAPAKEEERLADAEVFGRGGGFGATPRSSYDSAV